MSNKNTLMKILKSRKYKQRIVADKTKYNRKQMITIEQMIADGVPFAKWETNDLRDRMNDVQEIIAMDGGPNTVDRSYIEELNEITEELNGR